MAARWRRCGEDQDGKYAQMGRTVLCGRGHYAVGHHFLALAVHVPDLIVHTTKGVKECFASFSTYLLTKEESSLI